VAEGIRQSGAMKIMVCNLMTQPGETLGYTASDHLRVIESYLGEGVIQIVIAGANKTRARTKRYVAAGADFVRYDHEQITARGVVSIDASLVEQQDGRLRHDADKLGKAIVNLLQASAAEAFAHKELVKAKESLVCLPQEAC
jgi:uncharacterized cofD-like protein